MTKEEAIKHFEAQAQCNYAPTREAAKMAIATLLAQQETVKLDRSRWEGCGECKEPSCVTCMRYDRRNIGDPCTTSCVKSSRHKLVNFCQNCGRPLTEEAWAELEQRIGGNDGKAD